MKTLEIDIESYSSIDLSKSGVYRYAEADDFEILLFGYSVDGGDVQVVDLASGEELPTEIIDALTDINVLKVAHNAAFERVCLSRYLLDKANAVYFGGRKHLDPREWRCTMVHGAYCGLPLSLAQLGEALKLDKQKMVEGKKLISLFCKPDRKGKRVMPADKPEEWALFKEYNRRDVEAELQIYNRLSRFPVPDFLWDEYARDCEINDTGVLIDMPLVNNAVDFDERSRQELLRRMHELTEIENPNSVAQLKRWLGEQGVKVDALGKKEVVELRQSVPLKLAVALELRLQLAKSSVKKYAAMQVCVCGDNRARGLFQFYGSHTARSAGRLIQLQNLARGTMHGAELEAVREIVRRGDYNGLAMLYDNIPDVLSSLVRTALIPGDGCKFVVSDFSAVEARVLAWLAGEEWVLDVFRSHGKIYEAAAARIYKCDISAVTKEMRQSGKTATLACGYAGGVGSLKAFGADKLGMSEVDMQSLVNDWRSSNSNIVLFWRDCENAAKTAIMERIPMKVGCLTFAYEAGFLTIELPSGRKLFYAKAHIGVNRFGNPAVVYTGVNMAKKWSEIETYGGRLVENCTQAVARDLLFHSIKTFTECGVKIVAHVHDEVICEVPERVTVEEVNVLMAQAPDWAAGLPLNADSYECYYYEKR